MPAAINMVRAERGLAASGSPGLPCAKKVIDQAVPLGFRAERGIKASGSPGLLCAKKVELIRCCDACPPPPVGRCPIHCVVKVCPDPPDKLVRLSVAINMVKALVCGLPRTVVKVQLIRRCDA